MSKDDDLSATCICGCTTVTKRNGYHLCTLDDAAQLGSAASDLCRLPWWRRKRKLLAVVSLLILIATGGTFGIMERERRNTDEAYRLFAEGQHLVHAGKDVEAVEALTRSLELRHDERTFRYRSFAYWRLCDYERCARDLESAGDFNGASDTRVRASTFQSPGR